MMSDITHFVNLSVITFESRFDGTNADLDTFLGIVAEGTRGTSTKLQTFRDLDLITTIDLPNTVQQARLVRRSSTIYVQPLY